MRALAQTTSKESAAPKPQAKEPLAAPAFEATVEPPVQRKTCPCGGGCPRCQAAAAARLLGDGNLQAKLKLSQPEDPAEVEAEQIAEAVVSGRQFHAAGDARPRRDTIARAAAPEQRPVSSRIVEDETADLAAGQMRKSDFMAALRSALCETVDEALKGTSRSTEGCPWIERLFAFYAFRSASEVETAIRRYVPNADSIQSATGYISFIAARVGRAAAIWAKTGQVTGLPEGFSMDSPAPAPPTANPAITETGQVSFKTRDGAPGPDADAAAVRSQLGAGSPMESGVRSRMENAFGADFSSVRVHTDAAGAGLSEQLNARAFTLGSDVAFASGEYRPGTPWGDALMAHELAHVVQQGAATRSASNASERDSSTGQAFENDANLSAAGVTASLWSRIGVGARDVGRNAIPRLRGGLQLQRCRVSQGLTEDERQQIWETATAQQSYDLIGKQTPAALPELQSFVEKSRQILQDSSAEGILPAEIYQLWDAARASIIPLVPSAKAGVNDATNQALRVAAAAGIQGFYDKFRDLVSGFDTYSHNEMRGKFASAKIYINPFFSARDYREFSERLKKATSGSDWLDVFEDFKTASHRLFSFVATKYQNQARIREVVDLPAARQKIADTLRTMGPSLETGPASAEDVKRTADLLDDFYANLRTATAPLDYQAHTHAGKGSMGSTTYTASHFSDQAAYELRAGVRAARIDPGAWESVIEGFESSAGAVQTYLADAKRPGFSEQAEQLLLIGGVSAEVDAILRKHPDAIKVPAVFYPQAEADYVKDKDFDPVKGIPLYFYLYKDGKNWEMIDVTTPLKAKVNSADSLPNGQPDPDDLLPKLDSILRFPEGLLYVRFPDGHYWTQKTTARRTLSQWFTYIGLALGAAALGAATMGAGTAATILFFGSAVYGIAAASLDIYEKQQQGLLTVKDGIIDAAQIVSEVFGFTALTAGKIMRATTVAELGLLAEKVFVPSVKIKVAAQGVALIAMNLKTIDELNDIDNAGGSEQDRNLAKERITSSALTTTAMVIMSMEGDIADFQGRNLYIDKDFAGKALARPLRQDVHLFEQAEKTIGKNNDLADLLARKDIPDNLLTRIRGEVDYALDAAKIPKDRLRGIVSKLNNAPDATKVAEVLAELRYANRIAYAGELARDSQVVTGVTSGVEQNLAGGRKVKIDPVSEADALYVGRDGKIHLDEVKNTTGALRQKLTEKPQQLQNLAKWRAGGADREIGVAIESQEGWTEVFALAPGQKKAVLKVFIDEKIPLRIGPFQMNVAKMEELWALTEAKARSLNMWPPKKDFFDNMATLSDAEKFLGIKF